MNESSNQRKCKTELEPRLKGIYIPEVYDKYTTRKVGLKYNQPKYYQSLFASDLFGYDSNVDLYKVW